MKLIFNETGGRKFNIDVMAYCNYCVFRHSEWCNLRLGHPFHKWCGNEIYRETSLDIFYL